FLKLEIIKKIVGTIVVVSAIPFGLKAICIADFGFTMFALICNTYYSGKLIHVGYVRQILDVLPSFLLSCFMAICIFVIRPFIENLILQIVFCTLLGATIYITSSFLLKFAELRDLIQFFKTKKNS
ncbi:lipopolysaccharide biosynthesis protein, partial [Candidatus Saccharibacteria bacterium]|nr:lipopolysaccharide biosynthesis protein [Candidatus Saccharibacteria bacterium]